MQDLALQVAEIHHVVIGDPQGADARRSQIERRRRTQPARTDQQHARRLQALLASQANFRQAQVPRIAFAEIDVDVGTLHRQPRGIPGLGSTHDRGDVAIAVRPEQQCALLRTLATLAQQQYLGIKVGQDFTRIDLQHGAVDPACTLGHAQRVLVVAAHIDQQRTCTQAGESFIGSQLSNCHAADYRPVHLHEVDAKFRQNRDHASSIQAACKSSGVLRLPKRMPLNRTRGKLKPRLHGLDRMLVCGQRGRDDGTQGFDAIQRDQRLQAIVVLGDRTGVASHRQRAQQAFIGVDDIDRQRQQPWRVQASANACNPPIGPNAGTRSDTTPKPCSA